MRPERSQKTCGWCGEDAMKALAKRTCSKHEQCTKAVRLARAKLYCLERQA